MDEQGFHDIKKPLFVLAIFISDIILCMAILILLFVSLHQSYQGVIYSNKYVEQISLVSSSVGFFLGIILLWNRKYFIFPFRGTFSFLQMCMISGLFHLICALALIFYFASSSGYLMIVLGHIYREYGYLQLINATFYFGLFVYFIRCLKPLPSKG